MRVCPLEGVKEEVLSFGVTSGARSSGSSLNPIQSNSPPWRSWTEKECLFWIKYNIIRQRSRARLRVFADLLLFLQCSWFYPPPKVKIVAGDLFEFYFKTIINSDKLACSHPSEIYWHCRRVNHRPFHSKQFDITLCVLAVVAPLQHSLIDHSLNRHGALWHWTGWWASTASRLDVVVVVHMIIKLFGT